MPGIPAAVLRRQPRPYLVPIASCYTRFAQVSDGTWKPPVNIIVDHTKTDAGDRNTYLTEYARHLIELIKKCNEKNGYGDSEYLFVGEEGKLHAGTFDFRIRRYCRNIGISEKSMHKIRKTYISTLFDADLNLNTIREQVGHADEKTTLKSYVFNRKTDIQTQTAIEKALSFKIQKV